MLFLAKTTDGRLALVTVKAIQGTNGTAACSLDIAVCDIAL